MRKPDDPRKSWLHVGSGIVTSTEEVATNKIEAYAYIPEADSMSIPVIDQLRGMNVMAGSPVEIYAAIRGIKIGLEALRGPAGPSDLKPLIHLRLLQPAMRLIKNESVPLRTRNGRPPESGRLQHSGAQDGPISEPWTGCHLCLDPPRASYWTRL